MEIDFKELNESLNSAHKCKCNGCERRVCDPGTYCMSCFMGHLTDFCADDHPEGTR